MTCTINILDYILPWILTSLSLRKENLVIPSFNFHERNILYLNNVVFYNLILIRSSNPFSYIFMVEVLEILTVLKRCLTLFHSPYRPGGGRGRRTR